MQAATFNGQPCGTGENFHPSPNIANTVLLAAVHLQPFITIPPAALVFGWIVWYWIRLGRADVPMSRRKLRRLSLGLMALSLPMFVRALSFLDPNVQPQQYAYTWLMGMLMVILVIVIAGLDALNTVRLIGRQTQDELRGAASDLAHAIKRRQHAQHPTTHQSPTRNGKGKA